MVLLLVEGTDLLEEEGRICYDGGTDRVQGVGADL